MSIAVMTEVWKDAPVSGSELLMLLALADSANDDRECWPSVRHLEHKVRLSERQSRRMLKQLELDGLIEVVVNGGKGIEGRESNLYRILSMPPVADDTSTPVADDTSTPVADDTLNHHIEPSIEPISSGDVAISEKKPRKLHKNASWHDALLLCFKLTPDAVTKSADKTYWTAAADLAGIQFPVERIPEFYRWCKGQEWPSFTVMAMAKYAGEWLVKHQPRAAAPLDPAQDLSIMQPFTPMFIKRQQERNHG